MHVDTLELNASRQRMAFIKQAAEELGIKEEIIRHDVGKVLLKLEEVRDAQLADALTPKEPEVKLTDDERAEALALLRDPRLLERIVEDFVRCGVVGEETNKLVGYLGVVSRHLDAPLAVIVQSSSAAGKSSLMDAVLAFVPEEQRVQYSAMTGQSLFYMGESDLQHKVLAIVEEAGAQRASYALKLLQSEGELTIASTGKDPATGRLLTHQYRVKGPVMIFLTTTAIDIDEELLNRCLVLTVNEDRAQTQAIHRVQREAQTIEGLLRRKDRDDLLRLHRNAQRLLKPVFVTNPYAPGLTFLDIQTRTRRDHMKYLTLIRSIALLHQHQRPRKTVQHNGKPFEYIEVALHDIAVANRLAQKCWAARSTSCRRRRGVCCCWSMQWSRRNASGSRSSGPTIASRAATCGPLPAGAIRSCACIWGGWRSWNICWPIAAGAARASFTSLPSPSRATATGR